MSFKCSICKREVGFWDLAYVSGALTICKSCYPEYHVRKCPLVRRRASGENPPACFYCLYRDRCDAYIRELNKG